MAGLSVQALVAECKRRNASPLPLLEAYRLYLVANLTGARCTDDDRIQGGMTMASNADALALLLARDVTAFFNQKLRLDPLQPIQEAESTPSRVEGAVTGLRTCMDEQCGVVAKQLRSLILDANGSPVPPGDRLSKDWRNRQRELLDQMTKWEPGQRSSAAEHFRDKILLYNDLLSISPAGEARDAVLRAELSYLVGSRKEAASLTEWFLPVNTLLARTTLDPVGFATLRTEMLKSSDPIVALYAKLEALAPRAPERLILLL